MRKFAAANDVRTLTRAHASAASLASLPSANEQSSTIASSLQKPDPALYLDNKRIPWVGRNYANLLKA